MPNESSEDGLSQGWCSMAFPESSSWVIEGEEAAEFVNRLFRKKDKRKLLTGTRLSADEAHKKVVEIARKLKK